jgi:hypothetical protein
MYSVVHALSITVDDVGLIYYLPAAPTPRSGKAYDCIMAGSPNVRALIRACTLLLPPYVAQTLSKWFSGSEKAGHPMSHYSSLSPPIRSCLKPFPWSNAHDHA